MSRRTGYCLLLGAAALGSGVLGFYERGAAQPPAAVPPFANSVEQRAEANQFLREIRDLLKEQNALLRSGEVKVVVVQPKKR